LEFLQEAQVQMDPNISTIIMGFINLSFTIVGALLVDRLGRRKLLLISIIGMTLCTLSLGLFFFLVDQDRDVADSLSWLPLLSLSIFIMAFAIAYGPVVWLMISEVYSKELSGEWHALIILGSIDDNQLPFFRLRFSIHWIL
jgi:MFS family permease